MPDSILVTVNGVSLDTTMAANMAREMAAQQGIPPQMLDAVLAQAGGQLQQQAIEQFIDRTLLQGETKRLDIAVDAAQIDAVMARAAESLPDGVTLEQALSMQGMSLDQLRADIESNERIRVLYESKTAGLEPVTDAQIEAFYAENTDSFTSGESREASHILIACDEKADEAARATAKAEADAVLKQLQEGADFGEVALAKSSCPSKNNGGALGSFERGRMAPAFEEAAFGQELGEIGPVVETPFGYHVIKVTAKQDAGVRSLEDASADIRGHLMNQAQQDIFGAYLKTLREGAEITYAQEAAVVTP